MAQQRGKQRDLAGRDSKAGSNASDPETDSEFAEPAGPIEEMMRRAISLGLAGFFTTEGAVRKALGDAVPKDWTDFLVDTSERTRSEFLERLSHEIGRVLDSVDVASVLKQLLEGRTLEVKAEFRLSEKDGAGPAVRFVTSDTSDSPGDDE